MAAMAEYLEVALVVQAGHATVGAHERLDVVDLEAQLVTRVGGSLLRVFAHGRGLKATALAGPSSAPLCRAASIRPDVIAGELASVLVGAVSRASRR
jgi:hypothetical protein